MRLRHESEIFFSGGEKTWRQSPVVAVIRTVILGIIFGGAGPLWYYLEAPLVIVVLCAVTAVLVVPLFIYNALATLRATNWLMRLDREQLWLNIRSYSNRNFVDASNAIEINCNEIETINKQQMTFVGPTDVDPGAVSSNKYYSLRICFRNPVPAEVVEAIKAERERLVSHRYFGFITVSSRSHDDPISLTDEFTLTVLWRSQNAIISPSIASAIDSLAQQGVSIDRDQSKVWLWSSLTVEEQDQMIAEMKSCGRVIEARRLLDRRERDQPKELEKCVDLTV